MGHALAFVDSNPLSLRIRMLLKKLRFIYINVTTRNAESG
jgi:hypothetical protein